MKSIKVLITGGGAPGIAGTIYSLKNNDDNRDIEIITVDARNDVVGKYISDKFYKVPKATEPKFLDAIKEIVISENVDVILPQVTRELDIFSRNKTDLENLGVKIIVMRNEILPNFNNKFLLMKKYSELGYDQGKYFLVKNEEELLDAAYKLGYPKKTFVVKLPVSNGMRGLRIVRNQKISYKQFVEEKPTGIYATLDEIVSLYNERRFELIAMEYFPGDEYTVDVYRSPISGKTIAIPRKRDVIRTGITFEGTVERNEELIKRSIELADKMKGEFCFGFQFKIKKNGDFGILESNPRVQGTMIMSTLSGANMIYWSVKESLGEEVTLDNIRISWGLKFKRLWGGIGIINEKTVKVTY